VLVVDDEPPARRRLRRLLEARVEVASVEEAGDGEEALAVLRLGGVEILFLDVQMPGGDGFAVLAGLPRESSPVVVFVTAFDQFAVRAFEVGAVDYLLKPFDDERFGVALDRAAQRLASETPDQRRAHLGGVLRAAAATSPRHLVVEKGERAVVLALAEVGALVARGNYVEVRARGESFLMRSALKEVEARLDRGAFLRVHRSVIVNLSRVREIRPALGTGFHVLLDDGARVPMSRRFRRRLPRFPGAATAAGPVAAKPPGSEP
jgi:two-component system, LytTR family, response regulator